MFKVAPGKMGLAAGTRNVAPKSHSGALAALLLAAAQEAGADLRREYRLIVNYEVQFKGGTRL